MFDVSISPIDVSLLVSQIAALVLCYLQADACRKAVYRKDYGNAVFHALVVLILGLAGF